MTPPTTRDSAIAQAIAAQDLADRLEKATLREANESRQKEWGTYGGVDLSFFGNELAGEVGEACNIIKKLERERLGMRGSRASIAQLAEELADVVICSDLIATRVGVELDEAIRAKFNATSIKYGLQTRLASLSRSAPADTARADAIRECADIAKRHADVSAKNAAEVTNNIGRMAWTYRADESTFIQRDILALIDVVADEDGVDPSSYRYKTAAAYQIVGAIAKEFDVFEHPEVIRALDYLADHNHVDPLPWPANPLVPSRSAPASTPAAHWREESKPDPHGDLYGRERVLLCGGDMTDDEIANAVFLDPGIGNLTAAKERIRWLSRALEATPIRPGKRRNGEGSWSAGSVDRG